MYQQVYDPFAHSCETSAIFAAIPLTLMLRDARHFQALTAICRR